MGLSFLGFKGLGGELSSDLGFRFCKLTAPQDSLDGSLTPTRNPKPMLPKVSPETQCSANHGPWGAAPVLDAPLSASKHFQASGLLPALKVSLFPDYRREAFMQPHLGTNLKPSAISASSASTSVHDGNNRAPNAILWVAGTPGNALQATSSWLAIITQT